MYLKTIKPSHLQTVRCLGVADMDEACQQVLVLTVLLFSDVVMPFSNAVVMRSNQIFY